jgi:hypothetical protein
MPNEILRCPHCLRWLEFERYNARLGNQGYMYCDNDSTIVTWSSYDPVYSRLANDTHPWMLDKATMSRLEELIIPCPKGGHFRFSAHPRCPHCLTKLQELDADPSHFVILGTRVDGEQVPIWNETTS